MQRLQTFQLYFLQDYEREYVYSRITRTRSNLWNVLIIGLQDFNYLIHGTNEFSKKKTDHSNSSNRQFLLGFILSCKIFFTCATNSLYLLPVAPCQSRRLTSLSIARWQSFLLLSILCIIMAYLLRYTRISFHFQSCLLASTTLNQSFISLTEPDSSYARLSVNSVLRINCCQI